MNFHNRLVELRRKIDGNARTTNGSAMDRLLNNAAYFFWDSALERAADIAENNGNPTVAQSIRMEKSKTELVSRCSEHILPYYPACLQCLNGAHKPRPAP